MAQDTDTSLSGDARGTYVGGCECRLIRFAVELDPRARDARTGSVWEHSVSPLSFRLLAGQESVVGYQFAAEEAHHFFCTRCSARVFSHWAPDGGSYYSVDLKSLYVRQLSALPAPPLARAVRG